MRAAAGPAGARSSTVVARLLAAVTAVAAAGMVTSRPMCGPESSSALEVVPQRRDGGLPRRDKEGKCRGAIRAAVVRRDRLRRGRRRRGTPPADHGRRSCPYQPFSQRAAGCGAGVAFFPAAARRLRMDHVAAAVTPPPARLGATDRWPPPRPHRSRW